MHDLHRLAAALGLAWLPVLLDPGAAARVAELHPLADSPWPWFLPEHALLLYLWAPLVVASGAIICLTPGLLLALVLGRGRDMCRWLLWGLALSLPTLSLVTALIQAIQGSPLRGAPFVGLCVILSGAAYLALLLQRRRRPDLPRPWQAPLPGFTTALLLGLPLLLLAVLAPKFHWECFNGDGIHAYESARLTLFQTLPFWPAFIPDLAPFPDPTSVLFIFPTSWFIRLFGELEIAARAPFALYVAALLAALVAVAESGRPRRLGRTERALVALGLFPYILTMTFSATYHPYAADLALPATQDTLLLVLFLAFVLALFEGRLAAAAGMAVLTLLSSPSGFLLLALCLAAMPALGRPASWRPAGVMGALLITSFAFLSCAPLILEALGLPAPGREYAHAGLVGRFRFLQFTDWGRLAFWVIPGGILPAFAFLAWRRLDVPARVLLLVGWVYAGLFYIQAFVSLHQFAPAMVLPLAAFWRLAPGSWPGRPRLLRVGYVAGILAAVYLSMPGSWPIYTGSRLVGSAVRDRTDGYQRMDFSAYQRSLLLLALLPYDFDPSVPHESYGGNPHVWRYYAERMRGSPHEANYLLTRPDATAPKGWTHVASSAAGNLFLKSRDVLQTHLALRPPTPAGARVYQIPRSILFRRLEEVDSVHVLDLKAALGLASTRK